jgi:rSAM/selenodomain-associated transferase 1
MKSDVTHRLVIFTKYPEPGQVKTRLIPLLGANGAAEVHRCMVVHTLEWVRRLLEERSLQVAVYFDGGNAHLMTECFGRDWNFMEQTSGDLGARLSAALALTDRPTIVVGTDCPDLGPIHIHQAIEALRHDDVVLGPAADGGYYLIGIRHFYRPLFTAIPWGTDSVCRTTRDIASSLMLSVTMLEELSDIDRPEDMGLLKLPFEVAPCYEG